MQAAKPPALLPWSRSFLDPKTAAIGFEFASGAPVAKYEAAIKGLRAQLKPTPESLCVIDMSGSAPPIMAGWEVDRPLQIASMAKLSLVLAAVQLRDDVQVIVEWAGLSKWRDVVPAVKSAWLKGKSPEFKALAARPLAELPLFDDIFDVDRFESGADQLPEFRTLWPNVTRHGRRTSAHWDAIRAVHNIVRPTKPPDALLTMDPQGYDRQYRKFVSDFTAFYDTVLAPVPFAELLQLAVKWSDNEAASACLSRLGLPFVWAVLRQTGLYDERAQRGLWLGAVYRSLFNSKTFRSPGAAQSRPIEKRVGAHEGDSDKTVTSTQVGTARACCMLLASLVQGTLFQRSNHVAIDLLEFKAGDIAVGNVPKYFYLFQDEMTVTKFGHNLMLLSKIGILENVFSECAYLLHIPSANAAPPGTPAAADAARRSGRSIVLCSLHARPDEAPLKAAGSAVLQIADKLAT